MTQQQPHGDAWPNDAPRQPATVDGPPVLIITAYLTHVDEPIVAAKVRGEVLELDLVDGDARLENELVALRRRHQRAPTRDAGP